MKTIATIIALLIKGLIITPIIWFGLSFYDATQSFWHQRIWFYLIIYLPLFMGYESFVSIFFNRKNG